MAALLSEACSPCQSGAIALSRQEQLALLAQLPFWKIVQIDDIAQLERKFSFNDFDEALEFANVVGDLAEGANHHPSILIQWGSATIHWWTHSVNGLHRNDFIMAAKTDYLHNN